MSKRNIIIFHPDVYEHRTNNEYTKNIYAILESEYEVKSLEWFIKHPFAKGIHALYLNWLENPIGRNMLFIQKFQYLCKLLILKWAHLRKIKICYVIHNKTPHNLCCESPIYQNVVKVFMQRALQLADVIVELCKHTEKYLSSEFNLKNLKDKLVLIPHGKYKKYPCDPLEYRRKYGLQASDLVFAFVGKMDKYKNIDIILRAFYQSNIDGKLLLVGKIEADYEKTIRTFILDDRVITDFRLVSNEDMSCVMQIADAVLLPYDNTSINSGILINAFSNETTVIGTNIEMLQDFGDEMVYSYNYSNVEEHINNLTNAMKRAETDGKEKLAISGHMLANLINIQNNWCKVKSALLNVCR